MTEIPEHLLRRSRERRAALGLSSGDGGEGDAASDAPAEAAAATPAAPARTGAAVAPVAPASAPAVVEEAPTYIAPPKGPHKVKIPVWVMPVLVAIPLWAFLYPGAFGNHKKATVTDPVTLGANVYNSAGCSTCHGANGEGGVGPALHGGLAVLTFPNVADHINWVKNGSQNLKVGTPYGSATRPGGQHIVQKADMPAFGNVLSEQQIEDVVLYERTKL